MTLVLQPMPRQTWKHGCQAGECMVRSPLPPTAPITSLLASTLPTGMQVAERGEAYFCNLSFYTDSHHFKGLSKAGSITFPVIYLSCLLKILYQKQHLLSVGYRVVQSFKEILATHMNFPLQTLLLKPCVSVPHISLTASHQCTPTGWCTLSMGLPVLYPVWLLLCVRLSKTAKAIFHCLQPSTPTCLDPPRSFPPMPPAAPPGSEASPSRGP